MDAPNITDWITAIAALIGIGPIVWALVRLFLKDKEKEAQLKFFQHQLDEVRRQTSEFQYQSTLMLQANEILEKQIQLQTEIHLENKQESRKRQEIEALQRINEIKPYFAFRQAGSSADNFEVTLLNKGGIAQKIKIESVDTDFVFINPLPDSLTVENNKTLNLGGRANASRTYWNSNQVQCRITILFEDIDHNIYTQDIRKVGAGGFQVDPPVFLK
jgi:hypothetical protein